MSFSRRLGVIAAVAGMAMVGVASLSRPAEAWWRGPWCCRVGIGVFVPPVVVAPAPVYAYPPPPVYYGPPAVAYAAPPARTWIPGHWNGPYWVPAHWS
jgi:hypothetical protein